MTVFISGLAVPLSGDPATPDVPTGFGLKSASTVVRVKVCAAGPAARQPVTFDAAGADGDAVVIGA